jgi:ankyrin repeat protein
MRIRWDRQMPRWVLIPFLVGLWGYMWFAMAPQSSLARAVSNGSLGGARFHLALGESPNQSNPDAPWPLLFTALRQRSPDMVVLLLKHGADPGTVYDHDTALLYALSMSRREAAVALLAAGADPNQQIERGRQTALHRLAARGDEAGVRFLLDNGADPNVRDYWDRTPADLAEEAGYPDLARALRGAVTLAQPATVEEPGPASRAR